MKYARTPSYESMIEDEATNPDFLVCPRCDGNTFHGVSGRWGIVNHRECWIRCECCDGTGELTPTQYDKFREVIE